VSGEEIKELQNELITEERNYNRTTSRGEKHQLCRRGYHEDWRKPDGFEVLRSGT